VLHLAGFLAKSTANGPGQRSVVWVQGCARACPGCFNPEMQDPAGGEERSEDEVIAAVLAADVEGVTFSGGEPFDQAEALARVAAALRARGLSVVCYSGNTYEELLGRDDAGTHALLANIDVLIDGPFVEELRVTVPLRGSSNQRLIALTDRYTPADLEDSPAAEVTVSAAGLTASGVDHADILARIRERLAIEHGVDL
jgi:anaerobic ribonucleoside-triphosphate reductase activating protein